VFGEQIVSEGSMEWFDLVRSDFENQNYTIGAAITTACTFDTPQVRPRLYFVGQSKSQRREQNINVEYSTSSRSKETLSVIRNINASERRQLETNPRAIPYLDGTPLWMARRIVKAYGNAIVIPQAVAFIESYMETL
jgi:site-specific DNA-cytosine methylase